MDLFRRGPGYAFQSVAATQNLAMGFVLTGFRPPAQSTGGLNLRIGLWSILFIELRSDGPGEHADSAGGCVTEIHIQ